MNFVHYLKLNIVFNDERKYDVYKDNNILKNVVSTYIQATLVLSLVWFVVIGENIIFVQIIF